MSATPVRRLAILVVLVTLTIGALPSVGSAAQSVNGSLITPLGTSIPTELGGLPLVTLDSGVPGTGLVPSAPVPITLTNTQSTTLDLRVGSTYTGARTSGRWLVDQPGSCGFTDDPGTNTFEGSLGPRATCTFVVRALADSFSSTGDERLSLRVDVGPLGAPTDSLTLPFLAHALQNVVVADDGGSPELVPGALRANTRVVTWYHDADRLGPATPPEPSDWFLPPTAEVTPDGTCDDAAPPIDAAGVQSCTIVVRELPSVVTAGPLVRNLFVNGQPLRLEWTVPSDVAYSTLQPGLRTGGWDEVTIDTSTPDATTTIPLEVTGAARLSIEVVGPDASAFGVFPGNCTVTFSDPTCPVDVTIRQRPFFDQLTSALVLASPRAQLRVTAESLFDPSQVRLSTISLGRWLGDNTAFDRTDEAPEPSDGLTWSLGRQVSSGDCFPVDQDVSLDHCAWFDWTPTFSGPVSGTVSSSQGGQVVGPDIVDISPFGSADRTFPADPTVFDNPAATRSAARQRAIVQSGTTYRVRTAAEDAVDVTLAGFNRSSLPSPATDRSGAVSLQTLAPTVLDTYNAIAELALGLTAPAWSTFATTTAQPVQIQVVDFDPGTGSACQPLTLRLYRQTQPASVPSPSQLAPVPLTTTCSGNITDGTFVPVAQVQYYLAIDESDWWGTVRLSQQNTGGGPVVPLPTVTILDDPKVVTAPPGAGSVIFDPATNATAVSGTGATLPVSCTPTGPYAIGDSFIECTAFDPAAGRTDKTYTLRVVGDPAPPGISPSPGSVEGTVVIPVVAGSDGNAPPLNCSASGVFGGLSVSAPCSLDAGGRARVVLTGVPLGTPGTVAVTVVNAIGRSASTTAPVAAFAPPTATNVNSARGTSPTDTVTVTSSTVISPTVTATTEVEATGEGWVTVGQYPSGVPTGVAGTPFAQGSVTPFDVVVSRDNSFSQVVIVSAPAVAGTTLWWYDAASRRWRTADPTVFDTNAGALVFTATASSSPSIAELTGTVFAVAEAPTSVVLTAEPVTVPVGSPSTVTAVVTGASGQPTPEVTVTLQPGGQQTTTNDDGVATFTVVADAAGAVDYRVRANGIDLPGTVTVTAGVAPTIGGTPPDAETGSPYDFTFSTAGLSDVTATGLPSWATLDPVTGTVSGTPTAPGIFPVRVTATNAFGTASVDVTITVYDPLGIATTSLPGATLGSPYSVTLAGGGGAAPLVWSATGLPNGLAISEGGQLSGTPTVVGTATVDVTVTDARGRTASRELTLAVAPAPTSSVPDLSLRGTAAGLIAGRNGAIRLDVTNRGGGLARGPVTLVAALPAGVRFVSESDDAWRCRASAPTIFGVPLPQLVACSTPAGLGPGSGGAVTLQVKVAAELAGRRVSLAAVVGHNGIEPRATVSDNAWTGVAVIAAP
jgi:hypothetical protein